MSNLQELSINSTIWLYFQPTKLIDSPDRQIRNLWMTILLSVARGMHYSNHNMKHNNSRTPFHHRMPQMVAHYAISSISQATQAITSTSEHVKDSNNQTQE